MALTQIPASAFEFLNQIRENNDRNWFAANKTVYQQQLGHLAAFTDNLLQELNRHDVIETAGPKAFTAFIATFVSRKIKRLSVPIGAAGSSGRANSGAAGIITILNQAIKALYWPAFGGQARRT